MRTIRFSGSASVTIPAGGLMVADPVALRVRAGEHVTVTLYLKDSTGPATNHNLAVATSYRATGDHLRNPGAAPFTERSTSWYYLAGLDVSSRRPAKRETIVAFGDSITDGQAATTDANRRYPDILAQRLKRAGRSEVVLNSGIGGNRLLNDSACLGESFLNRFRRDALDHPSVRTVITMGGINDIMHGDTAPSTCTTPNPKATSDALINGYRQLIRTAHAEGVKSSAGPSRPSRTPRSSPTAASRYATRSTSGYAAVASSTASWTSTAHWPTRPTPIASAPPTTAETACTRTTPATGPWPRPSTSPPSDHESVRQGHATACMARRNRSSQTNEPVAVIRRPSSA